MNDAIGRPRAEAQSDKVAHFYWFKIYTEVNSDIRYVGMSNELLGLFVRMLAMACNNYDVGCIPYSVDEIAFVLRITPDHVTDALVEFERRKLLVFDDASVYILEPERHFGGPGLTWSESPEGKRERKRAQREREKAADSNDADEDGHRDASPSRREETKGDGEESEKTRDEDLPYRVKCVDTEPIDDSVLDRIDGMEL